MHWRTKEPAQYKCNHLISIRHCRQKTSDIGHFRRLRPNVWHLRDLRNLNRMYKAHKTNVWWTMRVLHLHWWEFLSWSSVWPLNEIYSYPVFKWVAMICILNDLSVFLLWSMNYISRVSKSWFHLISWIIRKKSRISKDIFVIFSFAKMLGYLVNSFICAWSWFCFVKIITKQNCHHRFLSRVDAVILNTLRPEKHGCHFAFDIF